MTITDRLEAYFNDTDLPWEELKRASRDDLARTVALLVGLGMTADDAIDLVTDVWWAAASNYGA